MSDSSAAAAVTVPRAANHLFSPLVVGGSIVALLTGIAIFAPWIAPFDPRDFSGASLEEPSGRHLLGTNALGQDILSQLVWGARWSLIVAVGGASLATTLGVLVGVGAALVGGWADAIVMRIVDVLLALPALPLMLVVGALLGPSKTVVLLIIGFAGWPFISRIVRAQALTLRQRGWITAVRGFGGNPFYALRRHILPAVAPLVVTRFVAWIPVAVFFESGLAFLGIGDPTAISWGAILNTALSYDGLYFTPLWVWLVLPAGFAISLTVLGFTFLGIGLEPRFNPRGSPHV